MSSCQDFYDSILLKVDGELDEVRDTELQEHLASCPNCRSLYAAYRDIQSGVAEMEEAPPGDLTGAVMRRISQEKKKNTPVYAIKRMKFTLAAVAACFVLLVAGRFTPFGGDGGVQTQETMAEAQAEAVPETALGTVYAGEVETTLDDGIMLQGRSSVSGEMASVLEALNQDGYRGDLVELFDMSEEDVMEQFPYVEKIMISSGHTVYQIPWDDFDAVEGQMSYGTVVSTEQVGDWVYLWLS